MEVFVQWHAFGHRFCRWSKFCLIFCVRLSWVIGNCICNERKRRHGCLHTTGQTTLAYLSYYLVTMQKLPELHTFIHERFEAGNFAVRSNLESLIGYPVIKPSNKLSIETKNFQVENIGFSTSEGTVQRWSLTSHVGANVQSQLEEILGMTDHKCILKDLAQKGI